jgi:hypothetical protein
VSFADHLGIAGLIVALLGIALIYLAPNRKEFGWTAFALAIVLVIGWSYFANKPLTPAAHDEGPSYASATPTPVTLPDVGLRFVYQNLPALLLINRSDAVAHDIKWTVVLWNADLPDRNDPLPIPVGTFDWLRPHDNGGPEALFDSPRISSLIKQGNRLFGSASVVCPNCIRGRTYVVYINYGQGGWFAELPDERSGHVVVPVNFSKESREGYFQSLEEAAPPEARIPIADNSK